MSFLQAYSFFVLNEFLITLFGITKTYTFIEVLDYYALVFCLRKGSII